VNDAWHVSSPAHEGIQSVARTTLVKAFCGQLGRAAQPIQDARPTAAVTRARHGSGVAGGLQRAREHGFAAKRTNIWQKAGSVRPQRARIRAGTHREGCARTGKPLLLARRNRPWTSPWHTG